MTTRRWSLARRMTGWLVATTVALVVAVSGVSAFYLYKSVHRELDSLALEEVDEVRAIFAGRPVTPPAFGRVVEELEEEHPGVHMAWRLLDALTGETVGDFGSVGLLHGRPLSFDRPGETVSPEGGLRWRVESLSFQPLEAQRGASDLRVGLLIDGRARLDILRRFGLIALGLVLGSAALIVGGGLYFCRRASTLLRRVADEIRAASVAGPAAALPSSEGAPDEVRDVAEAFSDTLRSIRQEQERARLLIAGMAHELRSPVQNLLGETDVALLRDRAPEEYRRVLSSQVEELRDLARVVDNLVTLCAADERRPHAREDFDLAEEVRLRLPREQARAERRGVNLELEAEGDLRVQGDREALLLVVSNLTGNAVDFSPEGETVSVSLRGSRDRVEVVVDDAGQGVPEVEREHIFEPFYRGPRKNGQRVGYGLGLALSRTAVQAHGGSITVGSSPAGGARFLVTLPRNGAGQEPAPAAGG